jgi:hypothetical protein
VGIAAESRVGWTMAGVSAGIAGFWLVGGGLRDAELHGFAGFVANAYVNIVFGLAFPAVGARIFSRFPGHRLGRLYCLCGLPSSIKPASLSCAQHGVVDWPGSLPGELVEGLVSSRIWLCGFSPLLTFGVLWFSDGRMPFRGRRPVAAASLFVGLSGCRSRFSTPERRDVAERKATAVLATGAAHGHRQDGHDAGPHGRADAVARTVQVLGASSHSGPVGRLLADALDGPGTPVSRITRTTVPAR